MSIERVGVSKFLGVQIDSQLNRKNHTEFTCKKNYVSALACSRRQEENDRDPLLYHYIIPLPSHISFIVIMSGETHIRQILIMLSSCKRS